MNIIMGVQGALVALTVWFSVVFFCHANKNKAEMSDKSGGILAGIGFITNFFDTLGSAVLRQQQLYSEHLKLFLTDGYPAH